MTVKHSTHWRDCKNARAIQNWLDVDDVDDVDRMVLTSNHPILSANVQHKLTTGLSDRLSSRGFDVFPS